MEPLQILKHVDHTILDSTASWEQIQSLCQEALKYNTASVCVPPRYVKRAASLLQRRVKVCTVIGFPLGYSTPETKIFETEDAIRNGADEIDMVMNLALAKAGDWEGVLTELKEVKRSCNGRCLKVIIETSKLTEEEKIAATRTVAISGADYIKTSTGFQGEGAQLADIEIFKKHGSPDLKIKASGGIATLEQAQAFLDAGVHRLGSSKLVALVENTSQTAANTDLSDKTAERNGFAQIEALFNEPATKKTEITDKKEEKSTEKETKKAEKTNKKTTKKKK